MTKFPICVECYYKDRAPAICENCQKGSQFDQAAEPVEIDPRQQDFWPCEVHS